MLLVLNTGAHRYKQPLYRRDINDFLSLLDSIIDTTTTAAEGGYNFFRTTVPGHEECVNVGIKPYENHREYVSKV